MIEVSTVVFSLLLEALALLLLILCVWSFMAYKRRSKDRKAAKKLVEQIKHQSQTRLETTGSFLSDKYRLEGDELKQAVKKLDRSEKKFFQKFITIYLKRDAEGLTSMDACVAEMIDIYKSLSPIMPDAATMTPVDEEKIQEMANLKELNAKLSDELAITKETMANMISEFGNMFGGGAQHELAKHEVVEKVNEHHTTEIEAAEVPAKSDSIQVAVESGEEIEIDIAETTTETQQIVDPVKPPDDEVTADDDIDDILNSIDLSEDKKQLKK